MFYFSVFFFALFTGSLPVNTSWLEPETKYLDLTASPGGSQIYAPLARARSFARTSLPRRRIGSPRLEFLDNCAKISP
jgi:hypothetical protein